MTTTHGGLVRALAGAGLLGLLACGDARPAEPAPSQATAEKIPPAPATTPAAPEVPLPATPVAYADELAARDQRIAAIRARAAASPPAWLTLQSLAEALLERAHLSGDYDDYAAAEATLADAFATTEGRSGPWMTRARLHFTLHRLDPALADLERAAARTGLSDRERAAIDGLRADIAFQRGDYEAARAAFERLADARPGLTELARLATYRWKTGDLEAADLLYARALAAYEGEAAQPRAWVRLMRGLLDLDRGRHREALAHYEEAAAELSGYWLVEEHIAEVRALLGEREAAIALYRDLVERTRNPEFMDALAELVAADDPAEAAALHARARAAYDALLLRYPEAAAGHALEHLLARGDAPARALEVATANYAIRPNGAAATLLAEALLAAGEPARAAATIEAALASPWRSADLHRIASSVFAAQGDHARAASELAAARAIDPTIDPTASE
ncbi:MAG: hypothetical protein H6710_01060 [Myxococcales bacterium]|nr:hypothetical protein [Myxococcales bacterium]